MRVLMRLQGDLFDIIQTVKESEQEKLPLRAWWGGAFTVLAKQTFESLFNSGKCYKYHKPPTLGVTAKYKQNYDSRRVYRLYNRKCHFP